MAVPCEAVWSGTGIRAGNYGPCRCSFVVQDTPCTRKRRPLVLKAASRLIMLLLGVATLSGFWLLHEQVTATEMVSTKAPNKPISDMSRFGSVVIPSGTMLLISLDRPMRTDLEMTGDHFQAHIAQTVRVEEMTVFPSGTEIRGRLISVEMSHSRTDTAQMTLSFDQVVDPSGQIIAISTEAIMLVAAGVTRSDDATGGGDTVQQFAHSASGRNAPRAKPIGLAAGAAAGSVIVLATNGRQIKLPAAQRFAVVLSDSCRVPVAFLTSGR